jgi:glycosyltransferase involved in cell wall biosynthesis
MQVGVVIAAHNPIAGDLERAVASVRDQTFTDWRCVIVDDGSREPIPPLEGVEVVRQVHRGVSAARNRGAELVGGDLIAFLDQDDDWHLEKLERQVAFMRRERLDLCDTNFEIIRDRLPVADGYWDHHGDFLALLGTAAIGLSTLVVGRAAFEHVGGFDPRYPTVQDWQLVLALTHAGYRLKRLPEVLCTYRLHTENASSDYRAAYREKMSIYQRWATVDRRREVKTAISAGRRRTREVYAYQAIDAYRRSRDVRHLLWAATHQAGVTSRAILKNLLARGPTTPRRKADDVA